VFRVKINKQFCFLLCLRNGGVGVGGEREGIGEEIREEIGENDVSKNLSGRKKRSTWSLMLKRLLDLKLSSSPVKMKSGTKTLRRNVFSTFILQATVFKVPIFFSDTDCILLNAYL
jgi:hypothetical protein